MAAGQAESSGIKARHKRTTVLTHELFLVPLVVAVNVLSTAKLTAKAQEL